MPATACPDCGREFSTLAPVCPHCGRPSPAGMAPPMSAPAAAMQEETLWRGRPSAIVLSMKFFVLALILIGVPLLAHWVAGQTNDLAMTGKTGKGGGVAPLCSGCGHSRGMRFGCDPLPRP